MLFEALGKYLFNINTFHTFNFFLGTDAGELIKRFTELVFFGIIIYMIFSEYNRHKKREYKYLIVGFFALLFRQAVMCTILFSRIFGIHKFTRFNVIIGFMDNYLEIIALLLLMVAFIFPVFERKTIAFQRRIISSILMITALTVFSYTLFRFKVLEQVLGLAILDIVQIAVLLTPFIILLRVRVRYRKSVLLAFFIYLLIPLTNIISLVTIGDIDVRLMVIQQPLPFLSILLLMRTVYLKLVDKAFLRTKLKKSEERVEYHKELNKLKDHFISVVSHELRTPITSVKLYLALMQQGKFGLISSKQRKALQTLMNENNRLSDLINDLLIINKIEAHKIALEKEKFRLMEIIDPLYINIAKSNGIKVINKVKDFMVFGDKAKLKQVYINLINNAIKYSEGGSIELSSGSRKNEWFLSVKDTGIGISEDEIPKLFDKFYQVDNTLTRKSQGVGLGLSIVKHIVDLHKGRVEVESKIEKGTKFAVWIPLE